MNTAVQFREGSVGASGAHAGATPTLVPDSPAPVVAAGKLLLQDNEPFYIKGVTYGTFAPDAGGHQFPVPAQVARDFQAMAACGFNCVRTYTLPPPWVLDLAAANRLRILAGLAWEQHVTFLDKRALARDIRRRVDEQVRSCERHASILGYTIGNEIPAPIVRWHGRRKIEGFLRELFEVVKAEHPQALATYVNFPTTEYLELPFLDFASFNVYLERQATLSAYLKRLHNVVGDLPLILAEIGLDSRRNGVEEQAASLTWQMKTAFREGCAGIFAYAWTDEWYRGGQPIEDWDFGLTTRSRAPKPALQAVQSTMQQLPFPSQRWPRISVVVCSYNGAATIRDTFDALAKVDYPDFEVILVNDGSTDATAKIAANYDVRLISTQNQGLGKARNEGLLVASGEIIVYTDDDAYPPNLWLKYIATAFMHSDHACIGGPNLVPPEDGWIGQCVADSPGGPLQVLLNDEIAEHVPGCNMAFRRERLLQIGGFDPVYRAAGDDVDVCWRLQDKGWTIGFAPAAMVWHHRRATVKRYWRQQVGYGKAEALLEAKWRGRFSAFGHIGWSGRIYGRGLARPLLEPRARVYQGSWGLAPFQGLYQPTPHHLLSIALMPEWLLAGAALLVAGILFAPAAFAGLAMVAVSIAQAFIGAAHSKFLIRAHGLSSFWKLRIFSLIFVFHLLQPAARLWGRLKHGLTPWRRKGARRGALRPSVRTAIWSEKWRPAAVWLSDLEAALIRQGAITSRGGDYSSWDLEVRGGMFANARVLMALEDHAVGRQYAKYRGWFVPTRFATVAALLGVLLLLWSCFAGSAGQRTGAVAFLLLLTWQGARDWAQASGQVHAALAELRASTSTSSDISAVAQDTMSNEEVCTND